jgi:glycosyltransferase involved in cell wall biosynthesis
VTQVGGSTLEYALGAPLSPLRKLATLPLAYWEEVHQRRIIQRAGLNFVVGEELVDRYLRDSSRVLLLRESALRSRDVRGVRDRLTRPDSRFAFVGQVLASKGVFEAVRAFELVKRDLLPEARLDIVGDGEALPAVRRLVAELDLEDSVVFHGWVPGGASLFDLYRQMDVLLCLSHVDFMPRVIWEALGSSVIVVSTPVGSIPGVFTAGREISFVPVGDISEVEAVVRDLLTRSALRREMLGRGVERAREAVLETMVEELLNHMKSNWPELGGSREGSLRADG